MTKIIMSGFLSMRTGLMHWSERYVIIAGLTIAWFHRKAQLRHRQQPLGVLPLNLCAVLTDTRDKCAFSLLFQKSSTFAFKTETRKLCKRWTNCLITLIEEALLVASHNMERNESHAFGLYQNSLPFFCALQSGAIAIDDDGSDLDQESGSMSSVAAPDVCVLSDVCSTNAV